MTLLCVGGDHDGDEVRVGPETTGYVFHPDGISEKTETYMRLSVKCGTDFFLLAGMTPVAGLKRWQELTGLKQPA